MEDKNYIKMLMDKGFFTDEQKKQIINDFPELAESEDEQIRKWLIVQMSSIVNTEAVKELDKNGYEMATKAIAYLEKQKEQDNEEGDFTIYHPQKNGDGNYECIPFSFYGSLTAFSNDKDLMDFLNECFYDKEECERWCEVENKPELPECKHKIKKDSYIDYLCESSSDEKQKEQSITANDLDEEIHRFFDDCIDVHEVKLYGNTNERVIPVDCYEITARHFAKWGEKQKEEEGYEAIPVESTLEYKLGFKAGKESEKQKESLRNFIDDFPYSDQKEQKPEPVFKVGDKIKLKSEPKYPYREIVDIRNGVYYFDEAVHLPFDNQDNWEKEQKPAEWSEEDEEMFDAFMHKLEVCDLLTNKEIMWAKLRLKSLRPQPKQEWSEEDELTIADLINYFEGEPLECSIEEMVQRIKSLRPSWKPSEEQIKTLDIVISDYCHACTKGSDKKAEILKPLLEQLRKL